MPRRTSQSQNSSATSWEWIQNHPIVVLIIVSVAVVSTTFYVVKYHNDQKQEVLLEKQALAIKQMTDKYEQENAELRKRIVSIERGHSCPLKRF
jgi:hypothetical protein